MILLAGSAADADGSDYFAILLKRNTAGEDHNLAVVGGVDAEELVPGLGVSPEVCSGDIEGAGCPRFSVRRYRWSQKCQALAMRSKAMRLPPSSTTATFMELADLFGFLSAAAMMRRASAS